MNYELARKLKEAGFPKANFVIMYPNAKYPNRHGQSGAPTLEELIEACTIQADKRSRGNISLHTMWYGQGHFTKCSAIYWRGISKEDALCGTGDTFSEAVAELWLKLNKK